MADFPAMPLWTDAYLADTRHLSTLEHGAYLLLLMEAWRRPTCSLPNDKQLLARLAGVSPEEWEEISPVILLFWDEIKSGKEITQKKLKKEREFLAKQSEKNRKNAISRWNKTKKHDAKEDAENMQDEMQNDYAKNAPTTTTTLVKNNSKELSKKTRKNGTRLPEDWQISEALAAWIRDHNYSRNFIETQLERFKNYWMAAAGAKGVKLDWDATFRNWILKAAENLPKQKMTIGSAAAQASEQMRKAERKTDGGLFKIGDNSGNSRQSLLSRFTSEPDF